MLERLRRGQIALGDVLEPNAAIKRRVALGQSYIHALLPERIEAVGDCLPPMPLLLCAVTNAKGMEVPTVQGGASRI